MNVKLFVITFAIICLELNPVNANASSYIEESKVNIVNDGGIRTIVLGFASAEIYQETSTLLSIKIYDEVGNMIYSAQTMALSIEISTEGWSTGKYKVVTMAEGEQVSQDFEIDIL